MYGSFSGSGAASSAIATLTLVPDSPPGFTGAKAEGCQCVGGSYRQVPTHLTYPCIYKCKYSRAKAFLLLNELCRACSRGRVCDLRGTGAGCRCGGIARAPSSSRRAPPAQRDASGAHRNAPHSKGVACAQCSQQTGDVSGAGDGGFGCVSLSLAAGGRYFSTLNMSSRRRR